VNSLPLPKDPAWAEICLELRAMSSLCREMTLLYENGGFVREIGHEGDQIN
jgi:hypothetical protein